MPSVIKAGDQNPTFVKRLETVDTSDHLAEAKLVVRTARHKAQAMLQRTRTEADAIRQEAARGGYEAGFRRGYESGAKAGYQAAFDEAQKEFAADHANLVKAITGIIHIFDSQKRDLFITAKQDMLNLAAKVAQRVTKQVGVVNPSAAAANLQAAMELVEADTDLVVRINPRDLATIERFAENFAREADKSQCFSIVTDESIAPGGCHVATKNTEVDATLDTQIGQIAELVTGGGIASS